MTGRLVNARRALLATATLAAAFCAYWSARLAGAEILYGQGTAESVARAAALAPGDAQYLRRAAELADGERAEPALEAVLRARPDDAEALIDLGLRAEMRGDLAFAERELLEAARRDRGYHPRWSLANFYFRRRDDASFRQWARAALDMADQSTPLFRLLWNYTEAPAEILGVIPNRPETLRQYLGFLVGGPHWESADAVANRILARAAPEDVAPLMAYCDRLLEARRGRAALDVWNALARRKLSGFGELDPGRRPLDGAFSSPPSNAGFDWRLAELPGVTASRDRAGIRLSFNGEQPDACEPLWLYVMLEPGARYQMSFEYAASGAPSASGLRWRVENLGGQPAALAESEDLAPEGWRTGRAEFKTPAGIPLARLVLTCRRAPGSTRMAGSIRLRNIALERAD